MHDYSSAARARQRDSRHETTNLLSNASPDDAEKSKGAGFFKAAARLIFHPGLTPTEKLLVMAIGLSDRGDGAGGYPCNATLIHACGIKSDGPDKGMKSLRRLLRGLKDRGFLRIELSRNNKTGRVIFIDPGLRHEQKDPGHTGPPPRAYRPSPPRAYRPAN